MTDDDVARVLDSAAELVLQGWCNNGHLATNAGGRSVNFDDPAACRFCLIGAIAKAAYVNDITEPREFGRYFDRARDIICTIIGSAHLAVWNDEEAKDADEVAQALRKAAQVLRAR